MKLKLYSVPLALALILATGSCSKSDDNANLVEKCATVSSLSISQNIDKLTYKIQATGNIQGYQISFQLLSQTSSPEYNSVLIDVDQNTGTIDLQENFVEFDKTYKVHVRAICNNGNLSDWFSPQTILIKSFCARPDQVHLGVDLIYWSDPNGDTSSQYQVQYSLKGFNLGNGTIVNIPSGDMSLNFANLNLQSSRTYDFYVRSYCTEGRGWSSWSGPYSFYNE